MFLILSDYDHRVTAELKKFSIEIDLDRARAENYAEQKMISFLNTRYDTNKIFKKHTIWDPTLVYNFNDLVVLQADVFDVIATYAIDDLIEFNDHIYICIVPTLAGESPTTTPTSWTLIDSKDTFFTALQTDDFELEVIYNVGEYVVYEDARYINIQTTTGIELPTDTLYWTLDTTTVAAGTLPTAADWTKGDTRSSLIVKLMVDISKYELTGKINPRNVNEQTLMDKDDAIKYLMKIADPRFNICPELPEKTFGSKKGLDVVWDSDPKRDHGQDTY